MSENIKESESLGVDREVGLRPNQQQVQEPTLGQPDDDYVPPHTNEELLDIAKGVSLTRAHATIRRLNRRVQSAEAGLAEKVNANAGRSFGRALANSAATMYGAQLEDAKALIQSLRETALTPEEAQHGLDQIPDNQCGWPPEDCPLCDSLRAKLAISATPDTREESEKERGK
jgi:hypothetical protein